MSIIVLVVSLELLAIIHVFLVQPVQLPVRNHDNDGLIHFVAGYHTGEYSLPLRIFVHFHYWIRHLRRSLHFTGYIGMVIYQGIQPRYPTPQ